MPQKNDVVYMPLFYDYVMLFLYCQDIYILFFYVVAKNSGI